jgi:hypothetical protein
MRNPRKRRTVITRRFFFCKREFSPLIGLRFLVAVLFSIAVSLSSIYAAPAHQGPEKPYALIFGTIWGPDDRPVYGVKVKIRRADQKKAHWELLSDHHGEFAQRVPVGPADYLVWADLKGYKPLGGKQLHQEGQIKVHIENDEREDTGVHLKQ